jgi:predicted transcriptional regulator of viral defense system
VSKVQDRRELRRRLLRLAGSQSGLFTAAQARDVGYSYSAQKYHVDHGNWARIDRGVFRLTEWPPQPHEDLVRWVLWSGHRAVISHGTALSVHGIGDVDPARIHLTVPPRFHKTAPGLVLHTDVLPRTDIQHDDGFPITTPTRSILDVAAGDLDLDQLAAAIREGIQAGKVTGNAIRRRADEFGSHAALRVERALAGAA